MQSRMKEAKAKYDGTTITNIVNSQTDYENWNNGEAKLINSSYTTTTPKAVKDRREGGGHSSETAATTACSTAATDIPTCQLIEQINVKNNSLKTRDDRL